ncbi:MAG: ABC transporter permease [Clostridiales bacterium]|nr:ABC transporter permease [Clostridiales bacterium]
MRRSINLKLDTYTYLLLGFLVVILLLFTITRPTMLWKLESWQSMAMQMPEYGVMTLGVMLCFIAGCIDVSFVALGDLASIFGVMFIIKMTADNASTGNVVLAIIGGILIALATGIVGGLINGNLITRLGIPPILATLATQMVYRGLAIALTRGDAVTGLPPLYSEIGHKYLFGFLPVPMLVFIIVFLFCAFLLNYTTFGKKLYMIGSNPKATRFSAINNTRIINTTFVINGMIGVIGALLMVSTYNSAKADYGSSYIMRCILILVLAGVLPTGGVGKISNVLISIIIIQIISSCVNMFSQLNTYYSSLFSSVLLLVTLMLTSRLLGEGKIQRLRKKKDIPKPEN